MRSFILLLVATLAGTYSFTTLHASLTPANSLAARSAPAFKSQPSTVLPKQNSNDMAIVYGGQDVSHTSNLVPATTLA